MILNLEKFNVTKDGQEKLAMKWSAKIDVTIMESVKMAYAYATTILQANTVNIKSAQMVINFLI